MSAGCLGRRQTTAVHQEMAQFNLNIMFYEYNAMEFLRFVFFSWHFLLRIQIFENISDK